MEFRMIAAALSAAVAASACLSGKIFMSTQPPPGGKSFAKIKEVIVIVYTTAVCSTRRKLHNAGGVPTLSMLLKK
jgi:hypothetical protein